MYNSIWIFDGLTSSAILINYLTRVYPNINLTWSNHTEKMKHGIEIELIPEQTKLLIVPDAGSNDFDVHKQVVDKGIEILILDHHESSRYSEHTITINNQLDNYPNKWLSGAGIVYKFIQQLDATLGLNYSSDYTDLAAFGLVGDAMLLSSKETKWLITKGLNNIKNEFLKELIKENVDDGVELTPSILSFKCNPKVNSLIRVGTKEEKDDLFKALIGHQEITENPRLRKANKSESWARRMTRICNNTYARQRKLKETLMFQLEEKIQREKLYENTFMVIEIEGDFEMNMSGYIASFLVNKYRKPTLVLRKDDENDKQLIGSMRGYEAFMGNTKDFLQGLQLFDLCEGHQNAAGLKIDKDNFSLLDVRINKALEEIEIDGSYMVDLILPAKSITKEFIVEIEKYNSVFGKGIEPPQLAVENIEVNLSDMTIMGKTEDMMKIMYNGIELVKFSDVGKLKELKDEGVTVTMNIVGRTGLNSYRGNVTHQFVIEDIEILETKTSPRFVF